ncbi:SDR family oxidoreductase [Vitiosangium sp. GDMCC 1.1324]|uniref:SDR family oxidoreductase n=1 Tax=Vitiosangium sp. (strain GDMCC 1.1324) TaxID=2138576 RepID=UPI000D3882AA|nr:SDR family NAD(P)-dependent oxidoreductase [Vitiosangium sp. GDMCC 1.1324]PTL77383.1 short-chain dehydrogenase [Vitiosangium sp. GDMCC 1.1324]
MDKKVVVITGASAGIGAALAEQAGRKGWQVVLAARREPELRQVAARVGPEALPVVADVSRREDVQRVMDAALARFGQVDVWVNNAGRGISKLVSELTDEDFDEMMRVNVKSALYGIQAVLPHFQSRGRGHIINVSSMLGRVPYVPVRSAYNAAKHALNALTTNLRQELRERYPGIHVTTFLPGVVATEFGVNALGGGMDSRKIPGAQSVEETASVLVEVIERPRPDVYSRPEYRQQVIAYYSSEDLAIPEPGAPGVKRP